MEQTALQSAESWATIVAACITALAITVGGIAAFWKFVLQQPFSSKYEIRVTPCRARRISDDSGEPAVAYTVTLLVENQSAAAHKIQAWWRRLQFPDEVGPDYDPDEIFVIDCDREADDRYAEGARDRAYPLASGETYSDQLFRRRRGPLQQLCYVEYTLKYKKWFWQGDEYKSQILIAPIENEDLDRGSGQ